MKKGELIARMPKEVTCFSGRGTVWSFTIIPSAEYAPEEFADQAPYAIALVKLTEGPLVTAMLTDVNLADIHIGMPVEEVMRFLRQRGDAGIRIYGYKFRPPFPDPTEAQTETKDGVGSTEMVEE